LQDPQHFLEATHDEGWGKIVVWVFFLFLWVSACVGRLALLRRLPRVDDSWDIAGSVTGLKIHSLSLFSSYSSEIIRKMEVSLSAYAAFRRHAASISGLANV
jgi:hypothetical protein